VTIKAVAAKEQFQDLYYKLEGEQGVEIVSDKNQREKKDIAFYETFYFQAVEKTGRTPDILASLVFENYSGAMQQVLKGKKIETIKLRPDESWCGVIAEDMKITEYKTTRYDSNNNIVIFNISAKMANLNNFVLKNSHKQGIETITSTMPYTTATYYAIIPSFMQNLKFTYFNLESDRFEKLLIPIIVSDDSVVTQTDLNPYETSNTPLKAGVSAFFAFLFLLLFVYRKKKKYIFLTFVFISPIVYLYMPSGKVCVKNGSAIYLLPMQNGTVFKTTDRKNEYEKVKRLNDFVKIKLENEKIGWIYHEDICSN